MVRVISLLLPLAAVLIVDAKAFQMEGVQEILSKSSCNFAVDLLKIASKKMDENVIMSPISIGIILSILQQGASKTTLEQINNVLHIDANTSKEAYTDLIPRLLGAKKNITLEWGTGLYMKSGFYLEENFKNSVETNFGSTVEEVDFTAPSTTAVATEINQWISRITHGQINNLVDPSLFNDDTVMVLVNAIFFKGIWRIPFSSMRTRNDIFEFNGDLSIFLPFMRQDERYPAGEDFNLGLKWLELPYEDEEFSMLFILPIERHRLEEVIERLSGDDLRRLISNTETRYTFMSIPKFNLMWRTSLKEILSQLGLIDMFSESAVFEGISANGKNLRVSNIIHQSNIEVNEEGTEASAATYGFVQVLSLVTYPDEMIFQADHPFLVFIIDKTREIPLFAGRINNPLR